MDMDSSAATGCTEGKTQNRATGHESHRRLQLCLRIAGTAVR